MCVYLDFTSLLNENVRGSPVRTGPGVIPGRTINRAIKMIWPDRCSRCWHIKHSDHKRCSNTHKQKAFKQLHEILLPLLVPHTTKDGSNIKSRLTGSSSDLP